MNKYIFFVFILLFSVNVLGCVEHEPPIFLFSPEPNWIWNPPDNVNEVEVTAKIIVDDKGGVTLVEILSMKPNLKNVRPIKESIERSRFTPSKTRVKKDDDWTYQIMEIEYTFKLSW